MAVHELEPGEGTGEVLEAEPMHVLVIGEEKFVCADKLPRSYFIRYADAPAVMYQKFLTRLVDEDDQDRLWDAFEEVGNEAALEAVGTLIDSYVERPTVRSSPSRRGPQSTKRR